MSQWPDTNNSAFLEVWESKGSGEVHAHLKKQNMNVVGKEKGSLAAGSPSRVCQQPHPSPWAPAPGFSSQAGSGHLLTAGQKNSHKIQALGGGRVSSWGRGLLGLTSCSSSLTSYCWDHFSSLFIQLTNALKQLLCVTDCSRYGRYGRHQDLKAPPFSDLMF